MQSKVNEVTGTHFLVTIVFPVSYSPSLQSDRSGRIRFYWIATLTCADIVVPPEVPVTVKVAGPLGVPV